MQSPCHRTLVLVQWMQSSGAEGHRCRNLKLFLNISPPATSRRPSRPCPGGWRWGWTSRPCWASPARARPSPWPRSLSRSSAPPWCWPTIRPWPPSCAPSSGSFSPTTRWSISSPTTTTTSRRPTSPIRIPSLRRTPPSTRRSTACACPPPPPCWSAGT